MTTALKVLLVEDDPDHVFLVRRVVGDRGTDVRILLPRAVGARWPAHELTAGASR